MNITKCIHCDGHSPVIEVRRVFRCVKPRLRHTKLVVTKCKDCGIIRDRWYYKGRLLKMYRTYQDNIYPSNLRYGHGSR